LSQTISARSQVFSGAESREESTSFLKKRSKKLLFAVADFSPGSASRSKSFLVLFFKKEHSFFSIAAGLLLLCGPACAQIRQIIPLPPAKDSGYLAGDMLVMRTLIITDSETTLDAFSVPVPGPVDAATELRDVAVSVVRQGDQRRTTLELTYQIFLATEFVNQASLRGYTLKFHNRTEKFEAHVPEWFYHVSPLRAAGRTENILGALKGNQAVPPLPDQAVRNRFWASFAAMLGAALVLAGLRGWLPGLRSTPAPFARASARIARLPPQSDDALRELHRAFDDVFGQRMLADDIERFLKLHGAYASLREDIKRFFDRSAEVFFGPGKEMNGAFNVLSLARRLRRIERQW
jgi:hypothetical protein